jgi:hypothetical protein
MQQACTVTAYKAYYKEFGITRTLFLIELDSHCGYACGQLPYREKVFFFFCLYLNTSVHTNGHAQVIGHPSERKYSSRDYRIWRKSNMITVRSLCWFSLKQSYVPPSDVRTTSVNNYPWSRVLEKLTGRHLVKKFPVFYGTRGFITAFTRAHHLFLSWAR